MNTNTFSEKKAIIPLILFIGSWLFFSILGNRFYMPYFSNPDIDPLLLSTVNRVISKFYYSLILGCFYFLVLIPLFYKFPLTAKTSLFFPLFMIFPNDILPAIGLMLHTDNFFSPDIATFSWSNIYEYNHYKTTSLKYNIIFVLILACSILYFYYKKIKSVMLKRQNEQQNLDKI